MAVDIPQQSQENDKNKEKAQGQADVQSKSGGGETVSSTDEYQRRWIEQQEKQRENQKRLAQQGAIKDAKERQAEEVQVNTVKPKKKFIDGIGKYLIPSVATGGGIIGALFGLG